METVNLPAVLPGHLDLVALNQQLRNHQAQLDWSLFEKATDQDLAILLAGLDMDQDEDVLGIDSLSEKLGDRLLTFFENRENSPVPDKKKKKSYSAKTTPITPAKLFTEKFVPANSNNQPGQNQLFDTEFVPAFSAEEIRQSSEIESTDQSTNEQDILDTLESDGQDTGENHGQDAQPTVLKKDTHFELRQKLVEIIYKDLLGPAGGEFEEVDESSLTERYLVGVIAPLIRSQKTEEPREDDPSQQDNLAQTDKNSNDDGDSENQAPSSSLFPSSLGLTFCVDSGETALTVTARWGSYKKEESEEIRTKADNAKKVWRRYPMHGQRVLELGKEEEWSVSSDYPEVIVRLKSRRLPNQDWIITAFLENRQTEPSQNRDIAWLFQPELTITSTNPNQAAVFVRKPLPFSKKLDDAIRLEQEELGLLYRHRLEFAVGHNVSVHAETQPHQPNRAIRLQTAMIPCYEVPQTTPPDQTEIPQLKGLMLDMKVLARVEADALPPLLYPLVEAYESWIGDREEQCEHLPTEPDYYRRAGKQNLKNCRRSLERIRAGIQLLETNP
jgi:hypothetical protein